MTRKIEVIINVCNAIIAILLTASLTLLIIGVKDSVAIWEGFALAFLFTYWKQRYKIYIVRREREKIAEFQ